MVISHFGYVDLHDYLWCCNIVVNLIYLYLLVSYSVNILNFGSDYFHVFLFIIFDVHEARVFIQLRFI